MKSFKLRKKLNKVKLTKRKNNSFNESITKISTEEIKNLFKNDKKRKNAKIKK